MSDLQRTIEIIFQGTDNLSGTVSDINKKIGSLGTDISDATKPLADLGKNILAADTALNTLAAGGLVAAKVKSEDFKSQMNELNTILQLSPKDLDTFSQSVLNYAQDSTQSLTQITTALYAEASAGTDSKDVIDQLSASEKLAIGSKSELGTTAQTLAGIMNAYGASVKDSSDYSDALFTIVKDGITTMPQLSQSISQVTGIASNAGIDFDTLGAAIAGVTATGVPTSEAMTQIKAAINAIVSPSSQAQKAAKALGIDIGQAAIDSKGFPAVLKDIYDKTNGSQTAMKAFIPSVEGLQAVISLGADKSGVFAKSLDDMTKKAGATQTAFDQMKDNLNLVWQNILNNVSVFVIDFGDKLDTSGLSDSFKAVFQGLTDAVDAGTFDPIIDAVNDMIADVTEGIGKLAKNLPEALKGVDFSGFVQSMKDLGQSILDIFDIDLSSSSSLTDSIQGIVDAFATLNDTTSTMIDVFKPVVTAIKEVIGWYTKLDIGTQELIAKILGIALVVSPLAADIAALSLALGSMGSIIGIGSVLMTGVVALGTALGPIGLAIAAIGTAAAIFSMAKFTSETEAATKAMDAQNAQLDKVIKALDGLPDDAIPAQVFIDIDRGDYDQAIKDIAQAKIDYADFTIKAEVDQKEWEEFDTKWKTMADKNVDLSASINEGDFQAVEDAFNGLTKDKTVDITAKADVTKAKQELEWFDGEGKRHTILVDADTTDVTKAADEVEKIPTEKQIEIKLKGDIDTKLATIKSNAEILESSFEWTAKLDIAQVEAQAEIIKSAYASIDAGIQSTGDLMADAMGYLSDDNSFLEKWNAQDILSDEAELRQKSFELQEKLTNAQIEYQKAQTERLNSGEALIQIDSSGLEPALEMVMWEILEKVQVRAAGNSADFLLGL